MRFPKARLTTTEAHLFHFVAMTFRLDWAADVLQAKLNLRARSVHVLVAAVPVVGGKCDRPKQGARCTLSLFGFHQGNGGQAGPRGRALFPFFFLISKIY